MDARLTTKKYQAVRRVLEVQDAAISGPHPSNGSTWPTGTTAHLQPQRRAGRDQFASQRMRRRRTMVRIKAGMAVVGVVLLVSSHLYDKAEDLAMKAPRSTWSARQLPRPASRAVKGSFARESRLPPLRITEAIPSRSRKRHRKNRMVSIEGPTLYVLQLLLCHTIYLPRQRSEDSQCPFLIFDSMRE